MAWKAVLIGLFATVLMDLGGMIGTRLGWLRKGDPALLARWGRQLLRGRLHGADIRSAEAKPGDLALGLALHYGIGAVLAIAYFAALERLGHPSGPESALAYGFSTNAFPWLLMYPSMGFGLFGLRAPKEARLIPTSLVAHLNYGLGLWLGTWFL